MVRPARRPLSVRSDGVQRYLDDKFGEDLPGVRTAMTKLARSHKRADLAAAAFGLYEVFRPDVPKGAKGWGAAGELSLGAIEGLARPVKR
jgi:hypothetical protein